MKQITIVLLTLMSLCSVQSIAKTASPMADGGASTTTVACDYYDWYGTRYTLSGVYLHHSNEGGADDVVDTLYLTVNESTHNVSSQTVCDSATWQGTTYNTTGVYTYSYTNTYSCPSVDTLRLTVNYADHNVFDSTACESLMWHNRRYTESGSYGFTYFNSYRCLSTDTLRLTIAHGTHFAIDTASCTPIQWKGSTLRTTGSHICRYTTAQGCASADTVRLTILQGTFTADSQTVCDSLRWHDSLYTATGNYVYNYADTTTGCASADTLHLVVNYASHSSFDTTVCGGMLWNSMACTHAGRNLYTYSYTNAAGCLSTDTLWLTIYIAHNSFQRTVCDSIRWHDSLYTETGVYMALNFHTDEYCLNNDTLYLTVHHSAHNSDTAVACERYSWHGTTYTATGSSIYYYRDSHNCAASDTLHLTVNYGTHNVYDTSSCSALSWNGRRFASSGTHTFPYVNANGCASVDTIHLTILPDLHEALDTAVCDSIVWHNTTYTTANIYIDSSTDVNGCPVVDTLRLDVDYSYNTSYSDTACEYYYWHGVQYSESGVYTHVSSHYNACRNTDTLNLVIYPASYQSVYRAACDSLVWNEMLLRESCDTVYHSLTEHFCDSAVTLHLTVNHSKSTTDSVHGCDSYDWIDGMTYFSDNNSAQYTLHTSQQCDSVVTLALTMGRSDTGADTVVWCNSYSWRGLVGGRDTVMRDTLTNISGCDSIAEHLMHVNYSSICHDNVESCHSYRWVDGVTYYADTVVSTMLVNRFGCDSTRVMSLTITPQHTITFNANGGTGTMAPAAECNGKELVLPRNVYHRFGYRFGGWALAANDTTPYYHNRDTLTVTEDRTLYAIWISNCTDQYGTYVVNGCDRYTWLGKTYYYDTVVVDTARGVVPGECDSICTLQLTMHRSSRSVDVRTECDRLTWIDGFTYTTPVDASAQTVSYIVPNAEGCDSTILLHLTLNYSYRLDIDTASCDSLLWYDSLMHYASTMVEERYSTVEGCDSVIAHNLTIYPSYADTTYASICDGMAYTFCGVRLVSQGIYDTLLHSVHGCDSAVTLSLTLGNRSDTTFSYAACDSLVWNDSTYTATTTVNNVLTNAVGCDSTITVNLLILGYSSMRAMTATVCDSFVWHDGTLLTESTDTMLYTLTTAGCDSMVYLHLTVNYSKSSHTAFSVCGTFSFGNTTYQPSPNPYHLSYPDSTSAGCDSIVMLDVTVNPTYRNTFYDTICHGQTLTFEGTDHTATGSYPYRYTTLQGCDSTLVLELHVLRFIADTQHIVACDSLTWNGVTYYNDATASRFVQNPDPDVCDSVYYLQLRVSHTYEGGFDTTVYASDGGFYWHGLWCDHTADYTFILHTIDGCDSTVVMHLVVLQDTTDTTHHEFIELAADGDSWSVYPNPSRGIVTLQGNGQLSGMELFDVAGRRIMARKGDERQLNIADLPEGSYILRLITSTGNIRLLKIVKQR